MSVGASESLNSRKWLSPDGSHEIQLVPTKNQQGEPENLELYGGHNEQLKPIVESPLINSPFTREFAGLYWLQTTPSSWMLNRYLIFSDPSRAIGIIDAQKNELLLNTVFEAISSAPMENVWATIRYRPTSRNQEKLNGNEQDTLFIVDVAKMTDEVIDRKEEALFGHLQSTVLPGVALARPLWGKSNSSPTVAVAVWNWKAGIAESISYDPQTLSIIKRATLNLTIPENIVLSPWIHRDFEPLVLKALSENNSQAATTTEQQPRFFTPFPLPIAPSPSPAAKVATNSPFPFLTVFALGALVLLVILYLFRRKPQR